MCSYYIIEKSINSTAIAGSVSALYKIQMGKRYNQKIKRKHKNV